MVVVFMMVTFAGCNDSESTNARIEVWLTDAPGDYEEVNIDLQAIEVHTENSEDESGWISLEANKGIYNLLDLTNGIDTLIGTIEIPSGKISQIRLKLGSENTIKVGGQLHDLSTPGAQQSGLKIQVHQELLMGITYKILLDFDVARSIVATGNGTYKLKPIIRSIAEAQDGAIKGTVSPKESSPAVYAIMNTDTLGTTFCDPAGHFLIRGLPAGSYTVAFQPAEIFLPTTQTGVIVTTGSVTDIGIIEVPE